MFKRSPAPSRRVQRCKICKTTGMTNAEVLHQVEHGYRMASPQNCPPALYDIMLECWHKVFSIFQRSSSIYQRFANLMIYHHVIFGHKEMQCQCYRMQWNGLLLRPCSGSWKTFSRCRTQSTRTPLPTDLRLGNRPSLCIISSLLYCRQYTTVSIIRTYCDIRQLIINCNVESWVIFWALSKVVQCPFERWVTPFLLSPPIEN